MIMYPFLLSDLPSSIPKHRRTYPALSSGRYYDEEYGTHLLLQLLRYLESINVISFWYVDKANSSPAQIEDQFKLSELYIQQPMRLPLTTSSTTTTTAATTTTTAATTTANSGINGQRSVNNQSPQPPLPPQPPQTTDTTKLSSTATATTSISATDISSSSSSAGTKKVGGLNIQHNSPPPTVNVDAAGDGTTSTPREISRETSAIKSVPLSSPPVIHSKDMTLDEIEAHYALQIAAMRKQGRNQ